MVQKGLVGRLTSCLGGEVAGTMPSLLTPSHFPLSKVTVKQCFNTSQSPPHPSNMDLNQRISASCFEEFPRLRCRGLGLVRTPPSVRSQKFSRLVARNNKDESTQDRYVHQLWGGEENATPQVDPALHDLFRQVLEEVGTMNNFRNPNLNHYQGAFFTPLCVIWRKWGNPL